MGYDEVVTFRCGCTQRLRAKVSMAGERFKCPRCGAVVIVPNPDTALTLTGIPEPNPLTFSQRKSKSTQQAWERVARVALVVVWQWPFIVLVPAFAVAWLCSFSRSPIAWILGFLAIGALMVTIAEILRRHTHLGSRTAFTVALVLWLVCCGIQQSFGFYRERWISNDGDAVYIDRRYRSGEIYWRSMVTFEDSEVLWHTTGPMSESNNPHGEWSWYFPRTNTYERRWYWYGEEVDEGQWHLLNK